MPPKPLTPQERQAVRNYLVSLVDRYPGDRDQFLVDAGIPSATANAWWYGAKPTIPSGRRILKILQATGQLTEEALGLLEEAQQQADRAVAEAERLERRARESRGRDGEKQ